MKLKLSAAMVTLAILSSCGGGGGDDLSVDNTEVTPVGTDRGAPTTTTQEPVAVDTGEDRTRPASGSSFSSDNTVVKPNGVDLLSDDGNPPQVVDASRTASWPGLRYGNFLVMNNPWNLSLATYPNWYQDISLYDTGAGYGVEFDWDWGAESDTSGSIYSTKSYPEVIYGTKSPGERSGSYQETGLPVEIFDAPRFTIDYSYDVNGRRTASSTAGGTDSEFNVAIESFYHETCDVKRSGNVATDNTVFETMVWLKVGDRKPSGGGPVGVATTSDGTSYDVYTKVAENPNYMAFVAQVEQTSGTVLYSELLDYAQNNAAAYGTFALQNNHCLANILMGTEIWHGAGNFRLDTYRINRTYP